MNALESAARLFKALGDPSRLLIVNALLAGPLSVHEIATQVSLADPTVSFHLARLAEAGLVSATREQQYRIYQLEQQALQQRLEELVRIPEAAAQQEELQAAAFRARVLDTYIVEGRLRSIPAQLKKRRIVLQALADELQPQRTYTEAEVTAMLARWHEDTSTLRRELVNERLLEREHGIYRRVSSPGQEAR